jgi:hypothetical protein
MPVVRQVRLLDLVEGQQPTAFTPQTGRDAPVEGSTPGAVEVRLDLCLNAHETDHRSATPLLAMKTALGRSPQEYERNRTRSFLIDEKKKVQEEGAFATIEGVRVLGFTHALCRTP